MERKTYFVDVILPIAIPKALTYRVPGVLNEQVGVGKRAVVQLGNRKLYTGIIQTIHETSPSNYEAKYLEALLDDHPVVNDQQLEFWAWMSKYYCCSIGEVMTAALPSSLKLSSETKITIRDKSFAHWDILSPNEITLVEHLKVKSPIELDEVSIITQLKTVQPLINSLLKKGVIAVDEELRDRYQAKQVEYIRIHASLHDHKDLELALNQLAKSKKKLSAVMAYLQFVRGRHDSGEWMDKKTLQQNASVTGTIVQQLLDKNIFENRFYEVDRIPTAEATQDVTYTLNSMQEQALGQIKRLFTEKDIVLLHGVTSSGKTEVYNALIEDQLQQGKQVLFLLPEIALTMQLILRLQRRFGDVVGVYHSKFNPQERTEVWHRLNENVRYSVILGARSTIFLPFNNLGLVIVDEEHEVSFKQSEPAPRYHARDAALILAKQHGAKVLLGSATPSVESYWHASNGQYGLVEMLHRFGNATKPSFHVVDMKEEQANKRSVAQFSSILISQMRKALEGGHQIILFQNRRGYAPRWQCETCGENPKCQNCDIALTYHKNKYVLSCHYCGYHTPPPPICPSCGSGALRMIGFGTEKIEDDLLPIFPDKNIQRLDLDSTRTKNAYSKIIRDFENGEIDILVGTQMVSKGLDFKNVALAGILDADRMLNAPDFRSFERAFQMMTQVAGRAGRGQTEGKVVLQTKQPDHWVIQQVIDNNYKALYAAEAQERSQFKYPPFYRLINVVVKNHDRNLTEEHAHELAFRLRNHFGEMVLGPEFPSVEKLRNWFQMNLYIKFPRNYNAAKVKHTLVECIQQFNAESRHKKTRVAINVDPV